METYPMYDKKTEANEFVGDTEEEATNQATRFYGVASEELQVAIPDEVSGASGRVVIVASPVGFKPSQGGGGGREDRGRSGGRSDRGRGRDSGPSRGREARSAPSPAPVAEAKAKPSKGEAKGSLETVGQFVLGSIERLGLGHFQIEESSEEGSDFLVYQITGEACSALGSGDGRAIDAIQLLANQVARGSEDSASRVVIEVEGKSEERAGSLEKLAERAADRAVESGRALALDAMNGRDRRIVHLALKERDGVATMGIGEGRYRQVLVVPEGAPEFDEAVASSQASS